LHDTIDPARYHRGHTFACVEQDGGSVRVHFVDGRTESADLLIGCDGSRSAVRGDVAPSVHPIYSGYVVWRGVCDEAALSSKTIDSIFPYLTFFLPEGQQILGYPISGRNDDLRAGHRRYNFVWYRAADAKKLAGMCVDETGHQHKFSVPPPLTRQTLIREMRAEARETFPPQFLDCLHNVQQPFFTPIYDFSMPSITFGRVALVGDAASTPRPHVGFGVAKAGTDAQALADALRNHNDIDRALAQYNVERQPIGERVVLHSRKLGTQLGVNLKTDEDRRTWKRLQSCDAVMEWMGAPNFLASGFLADPH